jgi:peptide/nickel transport system substrate-binding protein
MSSYRSFPKNNCISIITAVLLLSFVLSCRQKEISTQHPGEFCGGTYVDTLLGDASYLNPILASDNSSGSINTLIYNGLVKYDKDIKLVGELAESWTISSGGLVITFKLRKGVKWHDGMPFTARDVKYTYEKLIDPEVKTPYSSDYLLVKKFEILDPYTVRVTYDEPFAPALESWGMGIIPEHVFSDMPPDSDFNSHPANRSPVGTGPYKLTQWRTDEKIVLEANPDYFEGRPYIDYVIFRVIPDQSIQFLELRNESIDSMGLRPDQYKAYPEFFIKYNKFRYPSFSYTYLGFNLLNPLFQEKKIRLAIAHALNKQEIIDGVLLGMGKPATGPFVPQSWAYNKNITDYEYNLEKAKKLLAECGWVDSDNDGVLEKSNSKFQFTLITNQGNKLRQLTAEIVQRQLQKIGIKMNIRIIEWSAFIHDFINKKNFDVVILGWALGRDPDQYSIWHSSQTREGQYNFVSYKNIEVDRLIELGRHTFDQSKREQIYHKLHSVIFHDLPYVFLYYAEALPVVHKRFQGPEVAPLGLGWNFIKWHVPKTQQKY